MTNHTIYDYFTLCNTRNYTKQTVTERVYYSTMKETKGLQRIRSNHMGLPTTPMELLS